MSCFFMISSFRYNDVPMGVKNSKPIDKLRVLLNEKRLIEESPNLAFTESYRRPAFQIKRLGIFRSAGRQDGHQLEHAIPSGI